MLLRMWCFGREVFTIQLVRQDPTELLAAAVADLEVDYETEDDESAALSWTSSDAEDYSRVIWHPMESDTPDVV